LFAIISLALIFSGALIGKNLENLQRNKKMELLKTISQKLGQINEIEGVSSPIVTRIGISCARLYYIFNDTEEQITVCPLELTEEEIKSLEGFNEYPFQIITDKWQYTESQTMDRLEYLKIFHQIRQIIESD